MNTNHSRRPATPAAEFRRLDVIESNTDGCSRRNKCTSCSSTTVGPDFMQRRTQFRDEHLTLAWETADAGELLLAGALEDPTEQAFLLFKGPTPKGAERFAEADPYVRHGLVKRWRVKQWNTVVGEFAASPVRPGVKAK